MITILKPEGYAFISTTKSAISSEGFEYKTDYGKTTQRFRKRWTKPEFNQAIDECGFDVVYQEDITDAFGKIWMDYVVRKR